MFLGLKDLDPTPRKHFLERFTLERFTKTTGETK